MAAGWVHYATFVDGARRDYFIQVSDGRVLRLTMPLGWFTSTDPIYIDGDELLLGAHNGSSESLRLMRTSLTPNAVASVLPR